MKAEERIIHTADQCFASRVSILFLHCDMKKRSALGPCQDPPIAVRLDEDVPSPTERTCTGNNNVSLMGSSGTSRCRIAIHGSSEEVESRIRTCGIDIEILVVVAHGGRLVAQIENN